MHQDLVHIHVLPLLLVMLMLQRTILSTKCYEQYASLLDILIYSSLSTMHEAMAEINSISFILDIKTHVSWFMLTDVCPSHHNIICSIATMVF